MQAVALAGIAGCSMASPPANPGTPLRSRALPRCDAGNLGTIPGVGAYGAAMASTCNSRPLVAELLLDDGRYVMVCKRQSFDEMIAGECPATDWKTA